jgi:hypothetical protein
MARRLRPLEPVSSHKTFAIVAATVLLASLVLTGRILHYSRNGSGGRPPAGSRSAQPTTATAQAPYRIGGNLDCPSLWPVRATSNHTSYPAGHPARPPPSAKSVACFQTTAQAASAGYHPARLPAGALEVGGVYLAPQGAGFRASCQRAADRLGFAVPCPGLLPTGPPGAPPPRLCDQPTACRRGQVLRFLQGAFVVPPGYVGAPGGFSALSIVATPTHDATGGLALRCRDERRLAAPAVHRARAVMAACFDDPQRSAFGGSVLLRWSQQGTLVVVSVLDWSNASRWSDSSRWRDVNRRLAVALAGHMRFAVPSRGGRMPARTGGSGPWSCSTGRQGR